MDNELDDFVAQLQNTIFEETRAAYGDAAFDRWRNILFAGPMEYPDGHGRVTGSCGDTMQIYLRFENDVVKEATFLSDGCGTSRVCGSFAAELAHGKSPDELSEISGENVLEAVGTLPEEDRHCALLAAETLQGALHDYMVRQTKQRCDE